MRQTARLSRRELLRAALLASIGTGCARLGAAGARAAGAADAAALITKPIPSSGERLPVIGLGTDSFRASEADAIRAEIVRMQQLGGTVIDTAASYGDAESLIGNALAASGLRARLFLASKLTADGQGGFLSDGVGGEASFQRSLERLKTDRIDLMQVHNLRGVDELMPMLQRWKQQGRIRYLGITTSRVSQHEEMAAAMRAHPLDFIQVDYSIANRDAERTIFPLAQERRVAVLANLPLVHGQLIGSSHARPLPAWAGELGIASWSQYLLKYAASHPAVTCAIPGSTQVAHLEDNQRAGRGVLPDAATRKRMEDYWQRITS